MMTIPSKRRATLIFLGALALPAALALADDNGTGVTIDPAAVGIESTAPKADQTDSPDAYPKPSAYPISWELDVKHSDPKRIVVSVPGQVAPQAFWYVTYHVTNNSDQQDGYDPDKYQDIVFYPHFEMRTNDGSVIQSDDGISPVVFEAIKAREGNRMMKSAEQVGGKILMGEDHAMDSVAIFPEPDLRMGSFTIFASGMWGESAPVKDSDGNVMKDPSGAPILLHKTLMLGYHMDGDENPTRGVLRKTVEQFIMR